MSTHTRAVCRFLESGVRGEGLVGVCGLVFTGADPGFQVIGGVLKIVWGILCEKSRFYANYKIRIKLVVLEMVSEKGYK